MDQPLDFIQSLSLRSPIILRDYLKEIILGGHQSKLYGTGHTAWLKPEKDGLFRIPYELPLLRAYYLCVALAESTIREKYEIDDMMIDIMKNDLKRVTLPVAIVAWLTQETDPFRWHLEISDNPNIPEDLAYGLVVSYPRELLEYVTFVVGFSGVVNYKVEPVIDQYAQVKSVCVLAAKGMYDALEAETKTVCREIADQYALSSRKS